MAVFKHNETVDCTFLNTNAENIGATDTHLPIPLRYKPDFTFYLNTARQGRSNDFGHYENFYTITFYCPKYGRYIKPISVNLGL